MQTKHTNLHTSISIDAVTIQPLLFKFCSLQVITAILKVKQLMRFAAVCKCVKLSFVNKDREK